MDVMYFAARFTKITNGWMHDFNRCFEKNAQEHIFVSRIAWLLSIESLKFLYLPPMKPPYDSVSDQVEIWRQNVPLQNFLAEFPMFGRI